MSDWIYDHFGWIWGLCMVLFLIMMFCLIISDENSWNKWATENHCKVVSKESGTTAYVFTSKSGGIAYVPGKTGYLCGNGVTYYR